MPPIKFDTEQDALVVVLDESKEENTFFQMQVKNMFEKEQYVYYKNSQLGDKELFDDLFDKIMGQHTVMLPGSGRFIFCHFLDINDLSEDWLTGYEERMQYFMDKTMVDIGRHYHITLFRYHTRTPLGDQVTKVFQILEKMWATTFSTSHVEFLLYATGFSNLDQQEKGAARLLWMLSRRDYWRMYNMSSFADGLHVLQYDEFYEEQAKRCEQQIEEINTWLNEAADPGFDLLDEQIGQISSGLISNYCGEMDAFRRWSNLYPVSTNQFSSVGFGPFKHYERNQAKHPELEKVRKQRQEKYLEDLSKLDADTSWEEKLDNMLHYPDYINFKRELDSGSLQKRVENKVQTAFEGQQRYKSTDEERRKFAEKIFENIRCYVVEKTAETEGKVSKIEEEASEKKDQRRDLKFQKSQAARYSDLKNCFDEIKGKTQYALPSVIIASQVAEIAFVNGDVGLNWSMRGYRIIDVPENKVAITSEITPYEIQYLKLGRYVSYEGQGMLAERLKGILV